MTDLEIILQLAEFAESASVSLIFLYLLMRQITRTDEAIEQHIYDLRIQANHPIPRENRTSPTDN